jgi:Leucine-rich repeat (LRR) protein
MTIQQILEELCIEKYIIHEDESVTVCKSVKISNRGLIKIPIRFREILGHFYCDENQLVSLEGAPQIVKGNFYCSNNCLTSLVGAPQEVRYHFDCSNNYLTSLVGAPQVGRHFDCSNNYLTSLVGAPQEIKGNFNCSNNQLTSLEGVPQIIKGNFHCSYNKLINLNGLPLIGMYFTCDEYLYEGINYQRYKLKKQIKDII